MGLFINYVSFPSIFIPYDSFAPRMLPHSEQPLWMFHKYYFPLIKSISLVSTQNHCSTKMKLNSPPHFMLRDFSLLLSCPEHSEALPVHSRSDSWSRFQPDRGSGRRMKIYAKLFRMCEAIKGQKAAHGMRPIYLP